MKNYEKPTIFRAAVVAGHPNYIVYEDGRVFSIRSAKFLKPFRIKDGHLQVELDGEKLYVHRLVAEAFIPNLNEFDCVHHIDGNPTNNNVSNLIWISRSEHQRMHARVFMMGKTNAAKPVMRVDTGETFPSSYAASRALGLCDQAVANSINQRCKAGGSWWCYVEEDDADIWEDEPDYEGRNIFEEEMNDD